MGLSLHGKRLRLAIALTGAVAWLLQGYDQALMNGLLTMPSFVEQFPQLDTLTPELADKNSKLQGTAVALFEVGAAFGALSAFILGDRLGRKKTTFVAAIIALIGIVLQASSFQLAQLIVGRILAGVGVGLFTATVPTWVGECSDAHQRGGLILLEGSAAIFGVMFVGWLELGFYYTHGPVSFRFPIAIQAVSPLLVLAALPYLQESPRWLMAKDRHAEAATVLARLEDEPENSSVIQTRMQTIRHALQLETRDSANPNHSGGPFSRTPDRHLNRTLIAVAVNVLAQLSGINTITFYSNETFVNILGYSNSTARIITNCLQTWQFLMATLAVLLIDRFGRRKLLLTGATFMCIASAGLAGLESDMGNKAAAGASLLFYFTALAAFPIGLFIVPFLYASEIAPLRTRAQVTAMSACSNWIFNFLIAEVTPIAFNSISWRYYIVYACTNALSVVVFYFFLPETRDRSLEDIDSFFLASSNALQPRRYAKFLPPGVAEERDLSSEKEGLEGTTEKKEVV